MACCCEKCLKAEKARECLREKHYPREVDRLVEQARNNAREKVSVISGHRNRAF